MPIGIAVAPQSPKTGRPNKDHRIIISGILCVLRTGAPWRDLPQRNGPWRTAASWFYRWRKDGLWERLLASVQQQPNIWGKVNWELHYMDGTMVRAHQHAVGNRENPEGGALGRSQRGFSAKVHLTLVLTPGQRHEAPVFPQLMAQDPVKGAKGRPSLRPRRVVGDKGCSSRAIRQYAGQHGIRITIPRKVNECRKGPFGRTLYKRRNLVERLINQLT
jgi:transposase